MLKAACISRTPARIIVFLDAFYGMNEVEWLGSESCGLDFSWLQDWKVTRRIMYIATSNFVSVNMSRTSRFYSNYIVEDIGSAGHGHIPNPNTTVDYRNKYKYIQLTSLTMIIQPITGFAKDELNTWRGIDELYGSFRKKWISKSGLDMRCQIANK